MKVTTIRNFLIVLGCYWLSMWVMLPIALIHGKITYGIMYSGTSGAVLMHIVAAIPVALVAFGAGMLSKYILEDTSRKYWILFLVLLYASKHLIGFHWAIQPELSDRALQLLQSIISAITCYIGSKVPIESTKQSSH